MRENKNFNYILFAVFLSLFLFVFWVFFEDQKGLSLKDDLDIVAPARGILGDNCFFQGDEQDINTCRNKVGGELKLILNDQSIYKDYCFKGCRESSQYRSTRTSIMRDYVNEGRFNRLQCALLLEKILGWSRITTYNTCEDIKGLYSPSINVFLSADPIEGKTPLKVDFKIEIRGDEPIDGYSILFGYSGEDELINEITGPGVFEETYTYNKPGNYSVRVKVYHNFILKAESEPVLIKVNSLSPSILPSPLPSSDWIPDYSPEPTLSSP